jgi:hypothetical protein
MSAEMKNQVEALVAQINDKKDGVAALEGLAQIATEQCRAAEPFLVAAFEKIFESTGDKSKAVKDAAVATAKTILSTMSPFAVDLVMPALLAGLGVKAKPQQKEATLNIITALGKTSPKGVGYELTVLVSPVADLTCDIKKRS